MWSRDFGKSAYILSKDCEFNNFRICQILKTDMQHSRSYVKPGLIGFKRYLLNVLCI